MAYAVEWEIDLGELRTPAEADGEGGERSREDEPVTVWSFPPPGAGTAR